MYLDISMTFLTNCLIALSLSLIYSVFAFESKSIPDWVKTLAQGLAVGLVGIVVMTYPYTLTEGVIFDSRSIIMLTSSMYFGFIPAFMGGSFLIVYRIILGGPGTIPGILHIIIPLIVGSIWNIKRLKHSNPKVNNITLVEMYILLLFTQLLVISMGYLFPNKIPTESLNQIILPIIIINPLAGLAVSIFFSLNRRNYYINQELRQQKNLFDTIFNESNSAMFIVDANTKKFVDVNDTACRLYGYSKEEFKTFGISKLNPLPDQELERLTQLALANEQNQFSDKHFTKSGDVLYVETISSPVVINDQPFLFFSTINTTSKRTQKERLEQTQLQLDSALKNIHDAVILVDKYGDVEMINRSAETILNVDQSYLGKPLNSLLDVSFESYNSLANVLDDVIVHLKSIEINDVQIYPKDTTQEIRVHFSISPLIDSTGLLIGSMIIVRDITEQLSQYKKIQFISQHDAVTSLFNRHFLETELMRLDTKRQLPISFIIGDVNGLKLVNDAFTHDEGDRLLIEIASILSKAVRSEDILGRWGGDEFLILLPQTTHDNAEKIVKRIQDLSQKSFYNTITPSISLGIGTKTSKDQNIEDILLLAEKNMYAHKTLIGPKMRDETYHKLIEKLEVINPEFTSHHERCKQLAIAFGSYLNRSPKDIEMLGKIAGNHDIGKVSLSNPNIDREDNIIHDKQHVRLHVESGYRILNALPNFADISKYVLHHHENWDGTGYPEGLKGNDIPFFSRVVRVVEMYDSLMYHPDSETSHNVDKTIDILRSRKGHQLDPDLTEALIEMTQNPSNITKKV
jgi:diguanylate cyclase (GGDEF)-like protein/PAS domain S-box-containing protein